MNDAARTLLVEHIRRLIPQKATTAGQRAAALTGQRRDLQAIAERIEALRAELEGFGPAQEALERTYNAERGAWHYNAAMTTLGELAATARRAADELPKPQSRPALAFAALAWLHVESLEMNGPPTRYDASQGVQELQALCGAAGLHRSAEAVRKALGSALEGFDRHCPPFDVREFLDELRAQE
ncbi:MAG: hypothetical protein KGJ54_12580 [Betaproteobacteria bacterium]|nr:hypothetical protein [Betaproteobacteria bacterium]